LLLLSDSVNGAGMSRCWDGVQSDGGRKSFSLSLFGDEVMAVKWVTGSFNEMFL